MMLKLALLLMVMTSVVVGQQGSLQVTPLTSTLYTQSQYTLSYYTVKPLPASAVFELDFTSTYIGVPNATLNTSATVQNSPVSGATAVCASMKCTLKLNNAVSIFSNLTIVFGQLKNPYFLLTQPISTKVTFNTSYSEYLNWTIPTSRYTPLSIVSNSMSQSNYGVGNTDVTYTFNLTVPMTPSNPQLSVTVPSQVDTGNLQSSLSFYNSIQNTSPFIVGKILLFPVVVGQNNSNGIIFLTLSGLVNPKSIGSSNSFVILLQLASLPTGGSCSGCTVAIIDTGLLASSTVPGNIITLSLGSSNPLIGQQTNITVYSQLLASIPQGGKYQLTLPSSVTPKLPLYCHNLYGFSLTSSSPQCSYNSTTNTISTSNFYFSGTGNVVFRTILINPPDTRKASYTFQTFDATGNMIGNSSQPTSLSADPLPLVGNISKNAAQVDATFKLTVSMTLGIALTSIDTIRVVLPTASYTTGNIQCYSAGVLISCTTSIDPVTSNLTVSMTPPCSSCNVGSSLSFSIDALTNPSYISAYSQAVLVQTAHPEGVVEQLVVSSTLTASTVTISNYTRNGSSTVGSDYTLSLQHSIPSYVSTNGGMLLLKFTAFDSYLPVIYSGSTYSYPTSLTVADELGNAYSNTVSYDTSNTPNSVSQISIQLCGSNPCTGKIFISGLVRGYYPLTASTQNIVITTTNLDTVAINSLPVTAYTPIKASNTLGIQLSNSVTTLTSSYTLTLLSTKIPIQDTLSFTLSSLHTINAGCFAVQNSTLFTGVLTCSVINATTITVSASGDTTPMMVETIRYEITLTNVTNPATVQPLTYSLTTLFNSQQSQLFSSSYSIANPLPLSFTHSRSNSTYAQSAILTLTLTSSYPTFSEIKLQAPANLMTIGSSNGYQSSISNNTFEVSKIYSLSANNSLSINIVNPSSTSITGSMVMNMYLNGYLTAQGNTNIAAVGPVYLGVTASSSNRVVGGKTELTMVVNRVSPFAAESSLVVDLSSNLFDLTNATYNNAPLTLPLTVPITTTSITISNLSNLLSIQNLPSFAGLTLYTIDSVSSKVAQNTIKSSALIANIPATAVSYSYIRSNTVIGGTGTLTISYTASLPSTISTMTIYLPDKQMAMVTTTCQVQIGAAALTTCSIISSTNNTITIAYQNQSKVILSNVVNQQPNSNELSVVLLNSLSQLVQNTTAPITPAIKLNSLTVTGTSSTQTVSSRSTLDFTLISGSDVLPSSKIVLDIPTGTYTRVVQQDCSYNIGGISYNGCSFGLDSNGEWLRQVNLTNLGSTTIPANSTITLNLILSNGWTNRAFGSDSLAFHVCSNADAYLSQGIILLTTLINSPSFTVVPVNNLTLTQSNTFAGGSSNNLTLTFSINVPTPVGTVFMLGLPKSSYQINLTSVSSSIVPTSTSQNNNYYQLQFTSGCDQTAPVCRSANSQYTLTVVVSNQQYLLLTQNPITLELTYLSNSITSVASRAVPLHTALSVGGASISRSILQAYQQTTVTVSFNHAGLTTFDVVLSPMTTTAGNVPLLITPTSAKLGSYGQNLTYTSNSSNYITVSIVNSASTSTTVTLKGLNSFLLPVEAQKYLVTISDLTTVYYQSQVTPIDALVPYASGVTLQRTVTTVGQSTVVYLNGVFPSAVSNMTTSYNGNNYTISNASFNISLGTTTNPVDMSDSSTTNITIKNSQLIAFSSALQYSPQLTPRNLTAFSSFIIPDQLMVSKDVNLTVVLNSYAALTISLATPIFYATLNKCCIDLECSQNNVQSCVLTNTGNENKIVLTLKNSQNLTTVYFTVTTISYQATFTNKTAKIVTGLPSAQFDQHLSLAVTATPLISTLTIGSLMINTVNSYTLYVEPAKQSGYLGISLPSFAISQLSTQNNSYNLTVNGSLYALTVDVSSSYSFVIPVGSTTNNITLVMPNITNPPNSEPFPLYIHQSSDTAFSQIYAQKLYTVQMTQFDPITLHTASRNETKVALSTSITLNITTPTYTDQIVINFPTSQIMTSETCSVSVGGVDMGCTVLNSTAIATNSNVAGNAAYVINGLTNQLYFNSAAQFDLISVNLGYPYARASTVTSTTTFLSPKLTLGAIILTSQSSSTPTLLSPTTLRYAFTIENVNNITGFVVNYASYFYYMSSAIKCKINGVSNNCKVEDSNTIFFPIAVALTSNSIEMEISNVINYVRPSSWSIRSVQTITPETYSDVDVYNSTTAGVGSMGANDLSSRVLFPNHYAQTDPVSFKVLIDSVFSHVPLSALKLNITIPQGSCQNTVQNYQTQVTMTCTFPTETTATISIAVYHPLFPSTTLAFTALSLPILATPTSSCSNQQCDSCSPYNGQQYCFSCREGLYSSDGQCYEACPSGSYPYADSGMCQSCYPSCSQCFDYTMADCLSCRDPLQVVSSGTCQQECPAGQFNYLGYCVKEQECSDVNGCRTCSGSGFCYQCLPDFDGEPTCSYSSSMPVTLMIYLMIPFLLTAITMLIITAARCGGGDSLLSQWIFSFSFIELFAWILIVPIMPNIFTSMLMLSFLALRVIISIVAYEVYYRNNLGELSQKLLEDESQKQSQKQAEKKEEESATENASNVDNLKTKFARFMAHFNGPDAYELLKSRISEPILSVSHHIAVQILFMANRWIVGILMVYLCSMATVGDSILMPILVLLSSAAVTIGRVATWDKARACFNRCRAS